MTSVGEDVGSIGLDGKDSIGEVKDVAGLTCDVDVSGECEVFSTGFYKDAIDEGA